MTSSFCTGFCTFRHGGTEKREMPMLTVRVNRFWPCGQGLASVRLLPQPVSHASPCTARAKGVLRSGANVVFGSSGKVTIGGGLLMEKVPTCRFWAG
jgi:hypothetical protein